MAKSIVVKKNLSYRQFPLNEVEFIDTSFPIGFIIYIVNFSRTHT